MAGSWQSGDSHEEVWAGLPQSNLYKQKKLTGWRDSADDADEPGVVRRATHVRVLVAREPDVSREPRGLGPCP